MTTNKTVLTVKNVDLKTKTLLKSEAAKHNMTMGNFLKKLAEEHEKTESVDNFELLLKHKPILKSEKEYREVKKSMKEFRDSFKFRNDPSSGH